MKTLYAACLARLGLSQSGAAELHDVRLDTVKSWSAGRNAVPDRVWDDLRQLETAIVDRSEAIREAFHEAGETEVADARVSDHAGLMALADYFLTTDEAPPILNRLL